MKILSSIHPSGKIWKYLLFAPSFLSLAAPAVAQNYNNTYPEAQGLGSIQGGSRSIINYGTNCGMAVAHSTYHGDPSTGVDFQLTLLKPDGNPLSAFRFGDPNGNEYATGLCQSQVSASEFLMCGQSQKKRMLVMKVDDTGAVLWSKEIRFPFDETESKVIFPFNDGTYLGYIVVGHANSTTGKSAIVAARLDETGNLIWSNIYAIDQVKFAVQDAVVRHTVNDKAFTVSGFTSGGEIFMMNARTVNGALLSVPGARYHFPVPFPQLFGGILSEYGTPSVPQIALAYTAPLDPSPGFYVMSTDGLSTFTPTWTNKYQGNTPYDYGVNSMITLSNSTLGLLGSVNVGSGTAVPVTTDFSFSGALLNATTYNAPHELPASIIEACLSKYEAFTGGFNNLSAGVWDLRVAKRDNGTPLDCSMDFPLTVTGQYLVTEALPIIAAASGTIQNYNVNTQDVAMNIVDCNGNPLRPAVTAADPSATEASAWLAPNPATHSLNLSLGSAPHTVTLYALTGSVVWRKELAGMQTLSLEGIAPGAYHLEKTNAQGTSTRQVLIIQE